MRALVTGSWLCDDGAGGELAELQLVEDTGTSTIVLNTTAWNIPNGGAWSHTPTFQTDVAPQDLPTDSHFCVMGRLNGATSAKVRHLTVTMVMVV